MNKEKSLAKIIWIYGVVVVLANVCGVLLPNLFRPSTIPTEDIVEWERYLITNKAYTVPLQYITFILPTVWCILYTRFGKKSFESKIINLPLAFSGIGTSGWVAYIVEEVIFLIIAKIQGYVFNYFNVFISSLSNVILEATLTFTLAYFVTETIHRKYLLPKFFYDTRINEIPGVRQPSIKFLFFVNYISVTIFPIVYLLLIYLNISVQENKHISNEVVLLLFIILIGLVITIALINYFEKPIKEIKERIEGIKKGDYKSHLKIISNDSFGELSDIMNDMTDSIDEKTKRIQENLNNTIRNMAIMVEGRDNSTGGHIRRSSDCVKVFIEKLKENAEYSALLTEHFCNSVINAAPMHDLGKITIKDSILIKNGKFTDEEYEQMKEHAAAGSEIVARILESEEDIEFKKIAINVAHFHHEKWNGQGYPTKISGEAIPLESRIMALADVFDALVSKRCYKESFSYDKAFEIIQDSLGTHFDPDLGKEFIKCRPQLENLYNSY